MSTVTPSISVTARVVWLSVSPNVPLTSKPSMSGPATRSIDSVPASPPGDASGPVVGAVSLKAPRPLASSTIRVGPAVSVSSTSRAVTMITVAAPSVVFRRRNWPWRCWPNASSRPPNSMTSSGATGPKRFCESTMIRKLPSAANGKPAIGSLVSDAVNGRSTCSSALGVIAKRLPIGVAIRAGSVMRPSTAGAVGAKATSAPAWRKIRPLSTPAAKLPTARPRSIALPSMVIVAPICSISTNASAALSPLVSRFERFRPKTTLNSKSASRWISAAAVTATSDPPSTSSKLRSKSKLGLMRTAIWNCSSIRPPSVTRAAPMPEPWIFRWVSPSTTSNNPRSEGDSLAAVRASK